MNAQVRRTELLSEFVACWKKLDGLDLRESIDDISFEPLAAAQYGSGSTNHWRPVQVNTDRSALEDVYAKLPARFPPLYEDLVLTYRWLEVDLQLYRLLKNGFIPFGKGTDMDYHPVCFDLTQRKKNREFAIVKLDHEEILCNERIKRVAELAPSFEQLVLMTIDLANGRA